MFFEVKGGGDSSELVRIQHEWHLKSKLCYFRKKYKKYRRVHFWQGRGAQGSRGEARACNQRTPLMPSKRGLETKKGCRSQWSEPIYFLTLPTSGARLSPGWSTSSKSWSSPCSKNHHKNLAFQKYRKTCTGQNVVKQIMTYFWKEKWHPQNTCLKDKAREEKNV